MSRKKPKTSRDLVDALGELMDSVPSNGPEDDEEDLRAVGLDPDEVGRRTRTFVEGLISKSRLEASDDRKRALSAFDAFDPGPIPEVRSDLIDAVRAEIPQGMVAHRNFEEASDEDLRSLLKEIRFLRSKKNIEDD